MIYPAVNSCYTEKSPYKSVKTNGTGYLLTSVKMEDYVILYQRTEEDRKIRTLHRYWQKICRDCRTRWY